MTGLIWLGTLWGRMTLGAGLLVVLVGVRAWDVAHQRRLGEARAVAKIERATDHATEIGTRAAQKSRAHAPARRVRGEDRDPSTRDD